MFQCRFFDKIAVQTATRAPGFSGVGDDDESAFLVFHSDNRISIFGDA